MTSKNYIQLNEAKLLLLNDVYQLRDHLEIMSVKDAKKFTPLLAEALSISSGYHSKRAVELLLQVRPEWVDLPVWGDGQTALMEAARTGNLNLVDILVAQGADARRKNNSNKNALELALEYKENRRFQEAVVDAVVEAAEFTVAEKSFALAVAANDGNLGGVRSLLNHGADLSKELSISWFEGGDSINHGNALQIACFKSANHDGPVNKIIDALLVHFTAKSALDFGWDNEQYGAAIHGAAFNNNTHAISLLLQKGACVNAPDYMNSKAVKTPLMNAAEGMHVEAIHLLLEAGANAVVVDNLGKNALHYLVSSDSCMTEEEELEYHLPCLQALLEAGTNPGQLDDNGETPADLARDAGRHVLASHLEQVALGNEVRSSPKATRTGSRL